MAISGVKLAVGTGTVNRASIVAQGDCSLTFDRDVLYCETADGYIHIQANGASITNYAPGETTLNSALTQQISKNIAPFFSAAGQGVDARLNVYSYSAGKVTNLPDKPNPGDSVILEVAGAFLSGANVSVQKRRGLATEWAAFQFTDALPTSDQISGPIGWWNLKTPTVYDIDIDTKVAALPSLSLTGVDYPPVSDVIARLDQYWGLALLSPNDVGGEGYEAWVPQSVMDGLKETNYGEYLAVLIGAAANHLIGDVATTEQKKTIFIRMIQIGKEILEGGRAVNKVIGGPSDTGLGGHNQWEFIPMLCYLWARDLEEDLDNLSTLMPTCILGQPFYWTTDLIAQLAPHDNTSNICISRRRQITAVDGNNVTYAVSNSTDIPNMNTSTLIMIRESDNATAIIQSVVNPLTNDGEQTAVIDAQPVAPFEVGDTIYFQSPYAITEGDADWRVFQQNRVINPSVLQSYRNQQMWLDEILFPHALGIWRSDWDAAKDYVLRCLGENPEGFPQPWGPRSLYDYGGNSYQFDKSMWDAHAASYGLI